MKEEKTKQAQTQLNARDELPDFPEWTPENLAKFRKRFKKLSKAGEEFFSEDYGTKDYGTIIDYKAVFNL